MGQPVANLVNYGLVGPVEAMFPTHRLLPWYTASQADDPTDSASMIDEVNAQAAPPQRSKGPCEQRLEAGRKQEVGNAAQGDDEAEGTPARSDVAHSTDFRSVRWFGTVYSFTTNQAPVVRLLYEHWQAETPDVGDETLLFRSIPRPHPPGCLLFFAIIRHGER
jgi:hypothetical protein